MPVANAILTDVRVIAIDSRKLLSATVRRGKTGYFYWIGSDSWGAKIHPVRHQEWAAEGAITILPKRSSLEGESVIRDRASRGRCEIQCASRNSGTDS